MKLSIFALLTLLSFTARTQEIRIDKFDLSIQTSLNNTERAYADSLFNHSDFTIYLINLLPDCPQGENCSNESIILDDYNWNTPVSDSTFGMRYFKRVRHQFIDSSSITPVDSADYKFFLTELLSGPRERDGNEIIDICYNPRQAVIYKDEFDKIIAVQEICFECGHTKVAIYNSEMRYSSANTFIRPFRKYKLIE